MSKLDSLLSQGERLPVGGTLTIRCGSHAEMHSLRVSLSRKASKLYPTLSVSSNSALCSVVITKPEYEVTITGELSPEVVTLDSIANITPELARMISLMRTDGMSEADIAAFIKENLDETKPAADQE